MDSLTPEDAATARAKAVEELVRCAALLEPGTRLADLIRAGDRDDTDEFYDACSEFAARCYARLRHDAFEDVEMTREQVLHVAMLATLTAEGLSLDGMLIFDRR